jgi:catechol-2,3-dioxygenase
MPWPEWEAALSRREFLLASAAFGLKAGYPTMEIASGGFKEIVLGAHDLDAVSTFYGGKFGLATARTKTRLTVHAGKTNLIFEELGPGEPKPVYHFAFNIPENKLDQAKAWLSKRVSLVRAGGREVFHFESWNAHAIYFFDPAGNIGELIARHELPNASDHDFTPKDILYASEFALVVPDVLATVATIDLRLGMKPYRPASAEFAAVGDAHSLLIVVKEGRVWFATEGLNAKAAKASATIVNRSGTFAESVYRVAGA